MVENAVAVGPEMIPGWLPNEALWGRDPHSRRSSELTPLYVRRYVGPLTVRELGYHDFWELLAVIRGKGTLHMESPIPMKANFAYLIPPGTVHREDSAEKMDVVWIGLRGSMLDSFSRNQVCAAEAPELLALVDQLWLRAERKFGCIGSELDGLTHAVLARFMRIYGESVERNSDVIDDAVDYLHRNFARAISIADVAQRFGYSKGYFFRSFKQRTGLSPAAYLTRLRIENAVKLLKHSSLKMSRIANLCGYTDAFYFSRIFSKVTGRAPSSIRN